ncbi:MAG: 3-deoxy-D-manno-octulosonic acid transferase, partial [Pirellulales bacterium]
MSYLLNVLYVLLLVIASPWLVLRSLRTGRYREGFAAKLLGRVPRRESDRPCVWFHAVSVGEVNLLAPLLADIARRHPDWECAISTTTTTGLALARKKYPGHAVFYCPLDFSWAVKAALRRIRPRALVLVETELWPNLILAAKARGVRVAIANGRLSEHSFRGYLRLRPVIAPLVRRLDLIAAQNEEYAERFRALGARPESVRVTGSVKFDGAQTDRRNPQTIRLRQLAGFHDDDLVFLAGSTQEPEEALALAAFRQLQDEWPRLRLVLVPRHPERFDSVAELLTTSGLAWQRRSELPLIPDPPPQAPKYR